VTAALGALPPARSSPGARQARSSSASRIA